MHDHPNAHSIQVALKWIKSWESNTSSPLWQPNEIDEPRSGAQDADMMSCEAVVRVLEARRPVSFPIFDDMLTIQHTFGRI